MADKVTITINAKDNASKQFDKVSKSASGLDKTMGGLNKVIGVGFKVAMGAAVTAIGGLTAAIGVSVRSAMSMEQQLADIKSIMGLTTEETERMKGLIQDLGMDPMLKVSATEAADAIEMLGRNGLKMNEIMGGAARATVLLANATGGDFKIAADIATDAMAQFGINAAGMKTAVDGIASVTVNSKFSIDDYGLALAQAGGVASSVGVSFDDFNTTIAAISPLFASGSDAGTSFKTFLQRLVPSTNNAEEAMWDLGIITEESGNRFFDAEGNMRGMREITAVLSEAFGGLTEAQKNSYAATIFGTDSMRAAFGLIQSGPEKFDALAAAMANVDSEAMAATRMATFAGQLEILGGVFEAIQTQIGDQFLPMLTELTTEFTAFVSDVGPSVVAWFESFADWLNLAADYVRKAKNPIAALFNIFKVEARRLWGFVQPKLLDFWDSFTAWILDPARLSEMSAAITGAWTWFTEWAGSVWGWMSDKLVDMWDSLTGWVTDGSLTDAITNTWTWFTEWAGSIWGWMSEKLGTMWDSLTGWVQDGNLWSTIEDTWTWFTEWAGSVWGWVSDKLGDMWDNLYSWVADPTKREALFNKIFDVWTGFWEWAGAVWTRVQPLLGELHDNMVAWLNNLWTDENGEGLGDKLSKWGKEFETFTQGLLDDWDEKWPEIAAVMDEHSESIANNLERIRTALRDIGNMFKPGGEGDQIVQDTGNWVAQMTQVLSTWWEVFTGVFATMAEDIRDIMALFKAANEGNESLINEITDRMRERFSENMGWLFGRAAGGPVTAGSAYMVGEQGPEMFVPRSDGDIIPAHEARRMGNTYNVYLQSSGSDVRDIFSTARLLQALYG